MTQEEKIKQDIIDKFNYLKDSIIIKRERRLFLDVEADKFGEVFDYLVKNMNVSILSAITGMDDVNRYAVIYHIGKENGVMVNVRACLSKDNPVVNTVTSYFPAADIYERELTDLLGIKVNGLGEGQRYPLPEDWPENDHPLRKDWKGSFAPIAEVENG